MCSIYKTQIRTLFLISIYSFCVPYIGVLEIMQTMAEAQAVAAAEGSRLAIKSMSKHTLDTMRYKDHGTLDERFI